MSRALTGWYDPSLLGSQNAVLTGEVEIAALARLRDLLDSAEGAVAARFHFDERPGRGVTVQIDYEAVLRVVCQRCLEPFTITVAERSLLAIVEPGGSEDYAPEGYEPLLLEETRLQPAALLEDELIMALPLVPRHADEKDCGTLAERVTGLASD
jgi:uncharacterized protein